LQSHVREDVAFLFPERYLKVAALPKLASLSAIRIYLPMRFLIVLLTAVFLAGCGDNHRAAESRDRHHPSKSARAKAGARDFGHKVERGARHVGHKIHRFFSDDD